MSKIKLAFLEEFRRPMLAGLKTTTTRRNKHGEVGDTFEAFGETFRLICIPRLTLYEVGRDYRRLEGFDNISQFRGAWRRCGKRWTPNSFIWLHEFELVKNA